MTYVGPLKNCTVALSTEDEEIFGTISDEGATDDPLTGPVGAYTATLGGAVDGDRDSIDTLLQVHPQIFCIDQFTALPHETILVTYTSFSESNTTAMINPAVTLAAVMHTYSGIEESMIYPYTLKALSIDAGFGWLPSFDYLLEAQNGNAQALAMITTMSKLTTVVSLGASYFSAVLGSSWTSLNVYGGVAVVAAAEYNGVDLSVASPINFTSSESILSILTAAYSYNLQGDERKLLQDIPSDLLNELTAVSEVSSNVNAKIESVAEETEQAVQSGASITDAVLTTMQEVAKIAIATEEDVAESVEQLAEGTITASTLQSSYTIDSFDALVQSIELPTEASASFNYLKEQSTQASDDNQAKDDDDGNSDVIVIAAASAAGVVLVTVAGIVMRIRRRRRDFQTLTPLIIDPLSSPVRARVPPEFIGDNP